MTRREIVERLQNLKEKVKRVNVMSKEEAIINESLLDMQALEEGITLLSEESLEQMKEYECG